MLRPLNRAILMIGSLALLVAGCAAAPNGVQYDEYGNPINAYDSAYGGYDSGYGSDPYGSTTDYGSDPYGSTGGGYDSDYDSGYDSGDSYTGGSDSGYGASPSPSPTPPVDTGHLDDRPVLSAIILEVKETGFAGMGAIIAKVEIENPGNITLSGKLRVLFTDNGNPTANAYTRRVTLAPKEKQVLTFTAKAWRLDDAEASIETDAPKASKSDALN